MITLAIDFSTEHRAVWVTDHGSRRGSATAEDRKVGALSLIEAALNEAGIGRQEVELIAVGLGPGSYTGIRSAIATAQGWELSGRVKLCGIPSVDVMARSVAHEGAFAVAIDAQRHEFYCGEYRRAAGDVEAVRPLRIVDAEAIRELQGRGVSVFGPEPEKLPGSAGRVLPDAGELARMAAVSKKIVAGEELAPVYLRATEFKKAPPARVIE